MQYEYITFVWTAYVSMGRIVGRNIPSSIRWGDFDERISKFLSFLRPFLSANSASTAPFDVILPADFKCCSAYSTTIRVPFNCLTRWPGRGFLNVQGTRMPQHTVLYCNSDENSYGNSSVLRLIFLIVLVIIVFSTFVSDVEEENVFLVAIMIGNKVL